MYIKLKGDNEVIGNTYCCDGFTENIPKRYKGYIKKKVEEGFNIFVRDNQEWVAGKKYFGLDNKNYKEIFDEHWKKRVNLIQEFTDDVDKVEEILEFAIENDESDKVVEGIKNYFDELKE